MYWNTNTKTLFGPQVVVVRNGRIDFTGVQSGPKCSSISWIRFKRIGDAGPGTNEAPPVVPSAWLTGTENSWWHRKLNEAGAPVGVVIITPPAGASATSPNNRWKNTLRRTSHSRGSPYTDRGASPFAQRWSCRSHWLFAGDDCTERGRENSQFDPDEPGGENVGYTVTVSDQPCSGTAGCPTTAKTTVCEPSQSQPFAPNYCESGTLCPIAHDCKGATGDYVRIELRGERRVFDATVDVNRASFDPSSAAMLQDDAYVCWAVVPRTEATLPVPKTEFYTTTDPEDPIFYSTCFLKEIEWIWEDTGVVQKPTPAPWKVNGECINCDDWRKKSSSTYEFPIWRLDPKCSDCEAGPMPLSEWMVHDATIPGTGTGKDSGGGTSYPGGKDGIDGSDGRAVDEANRAVGNPAGRGGGMDGGGGGGGADIGGGIGGAVGGLVLIIVVGALVRRRLTRKGAGNAGQDGRRWTTADTSVDRGQRIGKAVAGGSVGGCVCVQMQDLGRADPHSPWQQHYDSDSTDYYYHNATTNATSWDPPATYVPCESEGVGSFGGDKRMSNPMAME